MRATLLMSAALLAASVTAGYAQGGSAQTPPAPGAASQAVQPANSMPAGASTLAPGTRGIRPIAPATTSVPASTTPPATGPAPTTPMPEGTTAAAPAPMPRHRMAMRRHYMHGPAANAAYADPENPGGGRAPADQFSGVPPTGAYQGGTGSPRSNQASNISGRDTRGEIAPRLPNPDANGNSPEAFLVAADRALARGQTGAAQEALERAQTRVLTRSTDPSMANTPDDSGMARAISDARAALASRDTGRARSIIGQVIHRGG